MVSPEEIQQIGPYTVRRFLGAGEATWAFEVAAEGEEVTRALKLFKAEGIDADAFGRFADEVRPLASLEHPNLVTIHDSGRDEATGRFYYTLTLFEGDPLSEKGTLPPERAGPIFRDALAGLARLHGANAVHGDPRPSHIRVARDGSAALADLGVARRLVPGEASEPETRSAVELSPEELRGERADARSDVFRVGLALYRTLGGRSMYDGAAGFLASFEDVKAYLSSLVESGRELEVELPDNVPGPVRAVIERACRMQPSARYRNATEMHRALERALAPRRERKPRPALRASFAGAAVTLLIVAGSLLVPSVRERIPGLARPPGIAERTAQPGRLQGAPDPAASGLPADLDFGRYHALVIGNDAYQGLPKLRTAVNDADAVAKLLADDYGYEVTLIREATRAQIIAALARYRRSLTPRDNLLVYYAGHGWFDEQANRGYWLPVDASEADPSNWVSNADITDSLRAMEAKHVMVVADSCYSGTLTRGVKIVSDRKPSYYRRMVDKTARLALTSGGLEPVEDSDGGPHSVFAKAFLDALAENPGVLDGAALFTRLRRSVLVGAPQVPEYGDIRFAGHGGGDFFFVRTRSGLLSD